MDGNIELQSETPTIEIENKNSFMNLELGGSVVNIVDDYERLKNKPSINGVVLDGDKTTKELGIEADNDYSKSDNKPSINGVELVGNKTSEDLKIVVGSDVNVLSIFDIGKTFEQKDIYNANVTNTLTLALLEEMEKISPFDVYCTISLATMRVSNISDYSAKIIEEKNKGRLVRMNCSFAENPILKVSVLLNVVDGNVASFYPLIVGDIGAGTKNYLFWLRINASSGNITATALAEDQALQEFIKAVEEFAGNISTMVNAQQNKINNLENRLQALENKIN